MRLTDAIFIIGAPASSAKRNRVNLPFACKSDHGGKESGRACPHNTYLRDLARSEFMKMAHKLNYGIVKYQPRKVIHVIRNVGEDLSPLEIDELIEAVQGRMLSRFGEQTATVVIVQGQTRETFRLFGDPHAVALVRTALFNAAVSWSPFNCD